MLPLKNLFKYDELVCRTFCLQDRLIKGHEVDLLISHLPMTPAINLI